MRRFDPGPRLQISFLADHSSIMIQSEPHIKALRLLEKVRSWAFHDLPTRVAVQKFVRADVSKKGRTTAGDGRSRLTEPN
jgi:hypothetical protein